MLSEQDRKFWKFIMMDDLDFYEEFILKLPDDQQEVFFDEVPDFMSDFPVWSGDIDLLKDRLYRGILRKIKKHEKEKSVIAIE